MSTAIRKVKNIVVNDNMSEPIVLNMADIQDILNIFLKA